MSKPAISSFLNTIKRTEVLEEMADTRNREEKVQNEPGMPGCAGKLKSAQRIMKMYEKSTEAKQKASLAPSPPNCLRLAKFNVKEKNYKLLSNNNK